MKLRILSFAGLAVLSLAACDSTPVREKTPPQDPLLQVPLPIRVCKEVCQTLPSGLCVCDIVCEPAPEEKISIRLSRAPGGAAACPKIPPGGCVIGCAPRPGLFGCSCQVRCPEAAFQSYEDG